MSDGLRKSQKSKVNLDSGRVKNLKSFELDYPWLDTIEG